MNLGKFSEGSQGGEVKDENTTALEGHVTFVEGNAKKVKDDVQKDHPPLLEAVMKLDQESKAFDDKNKVRAYLENFLKETKEPIDDKAMLNVVNALAFTHIRNNGNRFHGLQNHQRYALEFLLIKLLSRSYKNPNIFNQNLLYADPRKDNILARWFEKNYDGKGMLLLTIIAAEGLFEVLMLLINSTYLRTESHYLQLNASGGGGTSNKDFLCRSIITFILLAFRSNKLNLPQTKILIRSCEDMLQFYSLQENDLAHVIASRNTELLAFLLTIYRYNLSAVPDRGIAPIELALRDVEQSSDWCMVDFLLQRGVKLNDERYITFKGFKPASTLLKTMAAEGRIDTVVGLIARGAACAFDSGTHSALPRENPQEGKAENPNLKMVRLYLTAIKELQEGNTAEYKIAYDKLDPKYKPAFDEYTKNYNVSSNSKPAPQTTADTKESKSELKQSAMPALIKNDNPLLQTVIQIGESKQDIPQLEIQQQLEQAYMGCLEIGILPFAEGRHPIKLGVVIERAAKLHIGNTQLTHNQLHVLNYLLNKFISLFPDPDVENLLKKENQDHVCLLHIAIGQGLFDVVMLILNQAKFDCTMRDVNQYSTISYAVVALQNKKLTFEQTIAIIKKFNKAEPKDLEIVIATKNLALLAEFLKHFEMNLEKIPKGGVTPLQQAAVQADKPEDWEIAKLLIQSGANLNQTAWFSNTSYCPLLNTMIAAGNINAAQGLLQIGAKPDLHPKSELSVFKALAKEEKQNVNANTKDNKERLKTYLLTLQAIHNNKVEDATAAFAEMRDADRNALRRLFSNSSNAVVSVLFPPQENMAPVTQASATAMVQQTEVKAEVKLDAQSSQVYGPLFELPLLVVNKAPVPSETIAKICQDIQKSTSDNMNWGEFEPLREQLQALALHGSKLAQAPQAQVSQALYSEDEPGAENRVVANIMQ